MVNQIHILLIRKEGKKMKKELKHGLEMLKEMMEEQVAIVKSTDNECNKSKLNGLIKAAYLLGYETIFNSDDTVTIIKWY